MVRSKSPKRSGGSRAGGPSKKAINTRYRLLQATMECLIDLGHANTSISTIADRAGVSRGAMQFHFPSKAAAIEAVIGHVLQRRLDHYRADMAQMSPAADFLDHALRAYWRQIGQPEFLAQQELTLAARTDPGLAKSLSLAYQEYIRQSRAPFLEGFPQWRKAGRKYHIAANLAQYLIEGMTWGRMYGHLDDAAIAELLDAARINIAFMLDQNGQQRPARRRPGGSTPRSKARTSR